METENLFIETSRNLSKLIYLKTGLIIVGVILVIHFSGQWRTPPLIDYRISLVVCSIVGLLLFFGLTQSSQLRSMKIDYQNRKVTVNFLTLWNDENSLQIPFARFSVKVDKSFAVKSYGSKWKLLLFDENKQVYFFFNDESGFDENRINEFADKLKELDKNNEN